MRKIRISARSKRILRLFLIFFGMIFGMCMILVAFTALSRNSWKSGLALEVQHVLDSYQEGHFTVGKYVELESALSTSTAVYTLFKKDDHKNQKYYGIIARIPSILGPVPAVFIYTESGGVKFAGYAVDNGRASDTVSKQISSNMMNYWENMIPRIMAKTKSN
ncbi:MAG: hypothetical protein IJM48_03640 [Treponema sp.]|nr:hypothetical protein [Treponema sp.]